MVAMLASSGLVSRCVPLPDAIPDRAGAGVAFVFVRESVPSWPIPQ
jgi:hypothetical protein